MRKIIFILFLVLATRTLISCCGDLDVNFRWSKAHLNNIDVSTSKPSPLVKDSSQIANYGFRLSFDLEKLASHFIQDFSLTKTYALSCNESYYNKDSVTSIVVITEKNFDATHPAGSSITEYILARPTYGNDSAPYIPISQNLAYVNAGYHYSLDCRFKPVTPLTDRHKFIVNVSFQSGRTLSDSTSIKLY